MKKLLVLPIITIFLAVSLQAQPGKRVEERVRAFRIAYFTEKLRLTPDESQNFWPLYNEYRDKVKQLREARKPDTALEELNDAEADKRINEHLDSEEKELGLKREYYMKIRKVLPSRKLVLLPRIEQEFNKTLLEKLREFRQEHRN